MTVKFITVKGPDRLARAPFYLGIPQHERTMSRREAYEYIAAAGVPADPPLPFARTCDIIPLVTVTGN